MTTKQDKPDSKKRRDNLQIMKDAWKQMTPEQRDQFRAEIGMKPAAKPAAG